MGTFAVGDVVLVPFPYADFSAFKKRPALVVSGAEFDNLILCQITSNASTSKQAVVLSEDDFSNGSLSVTSYIRPDKLFTIEKSIIASKIGQLRKAKIQLVKKSVRQLFE